MRKVIPLAVAMFAFMLLLAKPFWADKPYSKWSEEEIRDILSKSPWVQEQTFRLEVGVKSVTVPRAVQRLGQTGCPCGCDGQSDSPNVFLNPENPNKVQSSQVLAKKFQLRRYRIILYSALPIRLAVARLTQLAGQSPAKTLREIEAADPFEGYIVIALMTSGEAGIDELNTLTLDHLLPSAYLDLKGSKRRVGLKQYVSPGQAGQNFALLAFLDPASEGHSITAKEKELRFHCELNPGIALDRTFKLKKLLFRNKLEL